MNPNEHVWCTKQGCVVCDNRYDEMLSLVEPFTRDEDEDEVDDVTCKQKALLDRNIDQMVVWLSARKGDEFSPTQTLKLLKEQIHTIERKFDRIELETYSKQTLDDIQNVTPKNRDGVQT